MPVQHLVHYLKVKSMPLEKIEQAEELGKASFPRDFRAGLTDDDRQLHDDEQPEEDGSTQKRV